MLVDQDGPAAHGSQPSGTASPAEPSGQHAAEADAGAAADTTASAQQPAQQQPQAASQPADAGPDWQHDATASDADAFQPAGGKHAAGSGAFQHDAFGDGDFGGGRDGGAAAAPDERQPFDDDSWSLGQRFREPRAAPAAAEAGRQDGGARAGLDGEADAEAADGGAADGEPPEAGTAPPAEELSPEEFQVHAPLAILFNLLFYNDNLQ